MTISKAGIAFKQVAQVPVDPNSLLLSIKIHQLPTILWIILLNISKIIYLNYMIKVLNKTNYYFSLIFLIFNELEFFYIYLLIFYVI